MALDQIFAIRELMAHFLPLRIGGLVESRNLVSSNTLSASVMLYTGPAHSKYPGKLFFVVFFFSYLQFPELIPHPLLMGLSYFFTSLTSMSIYLNPSYPLKPSFNISVAFSRKPLPTPLPMS